MVTILKGSDRDPSKINSWRPITLKRARQTFSQAKLFESTPQVDWHHPAQFGFIPGKSTVTAMSTLLAHLKDTDEKYQALIFIDIDGAFNNLGWPATIYLLSKIGDFPDHTHNQQGLQSRKDFK